MLFNHHTTNGNSQLADALNRAMFEAQLPFVTGNTYFVFPASVTGYGDFTKRYKGYYPDSSAIIHETVTSALNVCVAGRGDVIIVAPGYTETVTGAGGLALSKSGVTIIGLGQGTLRPTFLMDGAATVDAAVSADNIRLKNLLFKAGHADVATLFEITTAKNLTLEEIEAIDNVATENFTIFARTNTTDNAADGLTIRDCKFVTPDTGSLYFLHLLGDIDGLVVEDNYVNMGVNTSDLPIILQATGKDMTNVSIQRNFASRLNDANDLFIDNDTTANSGVVAYNNMLHADTAGEVLIDADGVGLFENRATAVVTASGYLLPAVDS